TALHTNGTRLYVGGPFYLCGGVSANSLAYFEGHYWDGYWRGLSTNNTVYALGQIGGEEQVGGVFTIANYTPSPGWARFTPDGIPWFTQQPVSQGVASGANASFTAHPAPGYP